MISTSIKILITPTPSYLTYVSKFQISKIQIEKKIAAIFYTSWSKTQPI